ncbi:MAG: DUF2892 domain-containing protein [Natrialbaceae archaeon]|nr:DUF2892 domain-containing protein [Natrialbaceae archaeon]
MDKNVGGTDRIARLIAGPLLIIVGAAAFGGFIALAAGTLGLVLAGIAVLVGVILTVTGMTQRCVLNRVVGLNTYRDHSSQQASTEDATSNPK